MRRDPCTGLCYPYYYIRVTVWDAKKEEYDCKFPYNTQTLKEAIEIVKHMPVDADRPQIAIFEENYDDREMVAIKESYDDDPSEAFYDPRTNEDIA